MKRLFSNTRLSPDTTSRRNGLPFVILILATSVGIRLLALLRVEIIATDGLLYAQAAREILEGRWIDSNRTLLFSLYPAAIAGLHYLSGISLEIAGLYLNAIPAGLAVLPLYWWTRDAFNRPIASTTAWIYSLHPMLIRNSAPMMRDGLYWFSLLWTIYLGWSACRKCSFSRFLLSGFFAAATILNRSEGIALLLLVPLWAICSALNSDRSFFRSLKFVSGTACFTLGFPSLLLALNLAFLPPGEPLSGLERFGIVSTAGAEWFASLRMRWQGDRGDLPHAAPPPISEIVPQAPNEIPSTVIAPLQRISTDQVLPPPQNVQSLVDRIPVWNDSGDNINTEGYYLRSFLMMADEHRTALYLSVFARELLHGFRLPILIGFFVAIGRSAGLRQIRRDLPLLGYAALILGSVYYHLTQTNILEARYLFSLIPVVFPWSAHGINLIIEFGRSRIQKPTLNFWLRPKTLILTSAVLSSIMVFHALRLTRDEAFQKSIGLLVGSRDQQDGTMAGQPVFARAGYYAQRPFIKLNPHPTLAWNQIAASAPAYILLRNPQLKPDYLVQLIDQSSLYERIPLSETQASRYLVFRTRTQLPVERVVHSTE